RDAGVVVIERALDQALGAPGDLRACPTDLHVVERAAADDLADGTLAHLGQRLSRIAHAEERLLRIRELILHRKVQVDEVDVGGENARLEVARVDTRHVDLGDGLDPGYAPAPTRTAHIDQRPEALDHRFLRRPSRVEAARQPQDYDRRPQDEQQRATAAAAAPGAQERLELALQTLDALIEVRAALAGTAPPRALLTTVRLI